MIDTGGVTEANRLLERYFRHRSVPAPAIDDLIQDTWMRLVVGKRRGSVQDFKMNVVYTTAGFVLGDYRRRPSAVEDSYGEFHEEARLIQLYPEGGGEGSCRNHPDREAVPGKTVCQECLDAMKARAGAAKAAGKCSRHPGRDVVPGRTKCQQCIDREKERSRRRRAKANECSV